MVKIVKINVRELGKKGKERKYQAEHVKKVFDDNDDKESVRDWKLQNRKNGKIDKGERYKDKDFEEYDESKDGYGGPYSEN